MAALEGLAAVATEAAAAVGEDAEEVSSGKAKDGAAKSAKPRATQLLQMAERAVAKLEADIAEAEAVIELVASKGPLADKNEKKRAARLAPKLPLLRTQLLGAKSTLATRKAAADEAALKAQAAAADKAAKKEVTDPMTGELRGAGCWAHGRHRGHARAVCMWRACVRVRRA
jgi:hypothetical protein